MTAALARIATECGIALDYVDTSERLHRVSDGTLRSLLATMGIRVDSDADAEVALAERERARWRERVAPLIVIHEGERGRLRIRLAESMHAASLGFELATESGATFDKSFAARAASTDERATIDGDKYVAYELALPRELSHGYHRVRVLADGAPIATTCCAVAPRTCHRPAALAAGGRAWGASVQLYGVRSARNWGIGDFTDLATIVQQWGAAGAAVIGVNPLHALFPNDPQRASPYSPSSRLFVNTLYVDVTAIADFRECAAAQRMVEAPAFAGALAALRDASQVDYAGVAAAKRAVLELLHAHFREHHVAHDDERAAAFRRFIADGGEALRRHAMFEALQEHFSRSMPSASASSSTFNGRPICNSRSSTVSSRRSASASGCTPISPCRSTAAVPKHGRTSTSTRSTRASARRRMRSVRMASAGDCRRSFRIGLLPALTRRSLRCCVRRCVTPARCASIT